MFLKEGGGKLYYLKDITAPPTIMKKILITLIALGIFGTAGAALAFGGWGIGKNFSPEEQAQHFTSMIESQAQFFGISQEQMKAYWAEGKNPKEIAEVLGMTQEDLQAKRQLQREQQQKEHLQNLVDQGVITQSQADSRLENMPQRGARFMGHSCPFEE